MKKTRKLLELRPKRFIGEGNGNSCHNRGVALLPGVSIRFVVVAAHRRYQQPLGAGVLQGEFVFYGRVGLLHVPKPISNAIHGVGGRVAFTIEGGPRKQCLDPL